MKKLLLVAVFLAAPHHIWASAADTISPSQTRKVVADLEINICRSDKDLRQAGWLLEVAAWSEKQSPYHVEEGRTVKIRLLTHETDDMMRLAQMKIISADAVRCVEIKTIYSWQ